MAFKYKVFLSSSAGYSTAAKYIAEKLDERLITVWLSEWYYTPVKPWEETITEALKKSENLLILLDKDRWAEDKWFREEIDIALKVKKEHPDTAILVALLPGTGAQDIPDKLRGSTIFDLNETERQETTIKKIAYSIEPELFIDEAMRELDLYLALEEHTPASDGHSLETLLNAFIDNTRELKTSIVCSIAERYMDRSAYTIACRLYETAVHREARSEKPDNRILYTLYGNMAFIKYNLKHYREAINYFNKAIELLVHTHDAEAALLGNLLSALGVTYSKVGGWGGAKEKYFEALDIYIKQFGRSHAKVATVFNNIAYQLFMEKNYRQSVEYYRKALTVFRSLSGEKHQHSLQVAADLRTVENLLEREKDDEIKEEDGGPLETVGEG